MSVVLIFTHRAADQALFKAVLLPFIHALATETILTLSTFFSIYDNILADPTNKVFIKLGVILLFNLLRATVSVWVYLYLEILG